ncbi:hypothetical protein [Methylobacterium aquaticum]|uniref:hypothetical protein n=1 Tax=Methylobacterium aquaticum TaxID=270351 RepID=UPI0019315AF4|nr:hypothetical protein [Methylobacterium aquaticum]QRE76835.1 hypothetical protein F1D61_27730 [Methylobacterium aquaticum]
MPARRDAAAGDDVLPIDGLTPAVIQGRKAVAYWERGLRLRDGRRPLHHGDFSDAWASRCSVIAAAHGNLIVATNSRYSAHPLHAEAVALRQRLGDLADQAFPEAREARTRAIIGKRPKAEWIADMEGAPSG